jgi:glycosyltransferase involved in cell wall biosynthesis
MTLPQALHQAVGFSQPGNAVFDHACALQDALRGWGVDSWIYAGDRQTPWGGRVRPLSHYRDGGDLLLLHYALANETTAWARTLATPLLLYYHNVTPPRYLVGLGDGLQTASRRGREELPLLRRQTRLALAVSAYNERDLRAAGFTRTAVLPILIPPTLLEIDPDPLIPRPEGLTLLFVGRLAPNKRVEDLLQLLYYLRQIITDVHLNLVGSDQQARRYVAYLHRLTVQHDLAESVTFAGQVSRAALAAYYRQADFFVTLSEHEGFCVPLVESMRFDRPVIASACAAIPETLGDAGVLVHEKRYPVLAELITLLHGDAALRERVLVAQRKRVAAFAPELITARFRTLVEEATAV